MQIVGKLRPVILILLNRGGGFGTLEMVDDPKGHWKLRVSLALDQVSTNGPKVHFPLLGGHLPEVEGEILLFDADVAQASHLDFFQLHVKSFFNVQCVFSFQTLQV